MQFGYISYLLKLISIWSSLNYQIEISVCGTFDVDIIYLLIRLMHLETTRGIWQNKLSRFHILNNIAKLHVTFITVGTHVFISYDSQQTFIIDADLSITQFDWNCIYKLRLVIKNNQFQWYIYSIFYSFDKLHLSWFWTMWDNQMNSKTNVSYIIFHKTQQS